MKIPLFRRISACRVRLGPQYCVASRENIPLAGAALVAVRLRAFELRTDGYTPSDCGRPLTLPSRTLQSAV